VTLREVQVLLEVLKVEAVVPMGVSGSTQSGERYGQFYAIPTRPEAKAFDVFI